ncbi:MAG TPA: NUDIX hydrolase, partial [Gemmataceae bacterium]|nr:NUDIX hydrolase [Gemmataceae bacterium]
RRRFQHNGREGTWIFASRRAKPYPLAKTCDAVVIVPLVIEEGQPNRLIVIKEYRVTLETYEYTFPAGLVEPEEPIEQAIRRELKEETGLELLEIVSISPLTYSSSGLSDETAVVAFVKARRMPGGRPNLQDSEIIEVLELDYEQVSRLCDNREPINGRSWCILNMYRQLGAIR